MQGLTRVSGEYLDKAGQRWLCVQDRSRDSITCSGIDHEYLTYANRETFERWGWRPCAPAPTLKDPHPCK